MYLKMFLILTTVSLATALNCIVWECGERNDLQECARWDSDNGKIILNEDGCKDGFFCRTETVINWAYNGTITDDELLCEGEGDIGEEDESANVYSDFDDEDETCPVRDANDELASGVHPKLCIDNSDCLTKGNSTTECKCGMNGNAYCIPAWGSSAFEEYWTECAEGKGEINYWTNAWWEEWQKLYAYDVEKPDCAGDLLDWAILDALKDAADYAYELIVLGLFSLI